MIIESVLVAISALGLDLAAGDPRSRYHPTAWTGRLIAALAARLKTNVARSERLGGVSLVVVPCGVSLAALAAFWYAIGLLGGGSAALVVSTVAGVVLLKSTLAVRGMEKHAMDVARAVQDGDAETARGKLAMIVKRETGSLDEEHVVSGAIESIAESAVDGVTGPLFYFGLLGLPGAFLYRAVNTADSMVGYKSDMFAELGWFSAKCDTVLNYVPARITGLVMVLAAALLRLDWREAYRTMRRDCSATDSLNAGYTMAAAAGALGVKLEKIGHYTIGNGSTMSVHTIPQAVLLMKATALLFCCTVTLPMIVLLAYMGWWFHA